MGQKVTWGKVTKKYTYEDYIKELLGIANTRSTIYAINRASIGTIWIDGVPHTYNADKVATNRIDFSTGTVKNKATITITRK